MGRKILSAALLISLLMGTLWQTMTANFTGGQNDGTVENTKDRKCRRPDRKIGAGQYLCGGCR